MKVNVESKYFKQGLTIFLTLATLVIFYFILINLKGFSSWLGKLKDVAMPFVWGFVIAYILNSPYKRLKRLIAKKFPKAAKPVSVITVFTVFIVAITLFFYMVVPQIVNAITGLSDALPIYIYRAQAETEGFFENYLERFDLAENDIQNVLNYVSDNLFKNFDIRNVVDKTLKFFINTTVGIKNFLMGLIIAIYFLIDKKYYDYIYSFLNCDLLSDVENGKIYKEYQFYDEESKISGSIDLMIEYQDHIDIIDYKLKNIDEEEYIKQLNGYKNYIVNKTNKNTNIYLYSILGKKYKKI